MYTPNQIMGTSQTPSYHPIMRALVTYSNPFTGEIKVKIPAVTGVTSELSISYIGRNSYNGYWVIPEIGSQIVVSADDPNMTNLFWVQTEPFNPKTNEPTGFVNREDSLLTFSNATRTLTLAPVGDSYEVYVRGNLFTIDSSLSITIPDLTGPYYFYFDGAGILQYSTVPFDIEWTAPVAYVYWRAASSTAVIFAEERHGISMDWQTHEYLHKTRGAAYSSGFGISNYTTNGTGSASAGLIFDIANGVFFDEDLEISITHSANPAAYTFQQRLQNGAYVPVLYRDSNGWIRDTATQFPVKFAPSNGYPYYNTGNTLVQMDNNRYGVSWIVATDNIGEPVLCIMGQAEYANIGDAENVTWSTLDLAGLPIVEFRPLWKIIFQAQNSTYKAAIRGVTDIRTSVTSVATGGLNISTLDSLTDVTVTTPASGDVLSYSGTAWTNQVVSLVPTASVFPYAGSTAPTGWLLCHGQAISRDTYSNLFAIIGTTYGTGNGSTTFNLPDLRGRTVAGVDNMGGTDAGRLDWANTLGTAGGTQTHTLTTSEMPNHSHTIQRSAVQGASGTANLYGLQQNSGTDFSTTQTTGGGGAHNNMQPTILLNYIIKI